jgi:hypothetical protein
VLLLLLLLLLVVVVVVGSCKRCRRHGLPLLLCEEWEGTQALSIRFLLEAFNLARCIHKRDCCCSCCVG